MALKALYQFGFRGLAFLRACRMHLYFHLSFMFSLIFVKMSFDWRKELDLLEKLQVDAFLLENIYIIRRRPF